MAKAVAALDGGAPACVSVFAGRLADFGLDYRPTTQKAVALARKTRNVEIIWASTREALNVIEADAMGCHIITAPADVLKKLPSIGTKTAAELSLAAVRALRDDALAADLQLGVSATRAAEQGAVTSTARCNALNQNVSTPVSGNSRQPWCSMLRDGEGPFCRPGDVPRP